MTADLVTLIREYAAEHYYCESWDIVADQWTDGNIAAAIAGANTRRGAIAKAWGKLQVIDRGRRDSDRPVKPLSLLEFLAANGGLRCDDRLIGDVRAAIGGGNLFTGRGLLIRLPRQMSTAARRQGARAPMFLDAAREACAEAGYLPDVAWGPVSSIRELLDLIDREARGTKIYPFDRAPHEAVEYDDEEAFNEVPF